MAIQIKAAIHVRLKEALDQHAHRTGERLTYAQLASMAGLSQATVESLATRRGYNATLKTLASLCVVLRCSPGELLEMGPAQPSARRQRAAR